jgi:hypothetical protein
MATDQIGRIALLWRGDRDARAKATPTNNRLSAVFEVLASLNVAAEPAVYSDEIVDEVRDQFLRLDGVLMWVDPISDGHDRSKLDPMLREVAAKGVRASAHPDVILKMGTKEVLFRTRHFGWGTRPANHVRSRRACLPGLEIQDGIGMDTRDDASARP